MFIFLLVLTVISLLLLLHAAFLAPPSIIQGKVITIMLFMVGILLWIDTWGEMLCIQS